VISADEGGFVEYWKPVEPFGLPSNVPGLWSFKSETDLYEFKKVRRFIPPAVNLPNIYTILVV
jgi:peptidylprolyl isomerase domain and WD repeat-containing protein 1